jgi:hypothetical protein
VTAICAPQDNFRQLAATIGEATGIGIEITGKATGIAMEIEITTGMEIGAITMGTAIKIMAIE